MLALVLAGPVFLQYAAVDAVNHRPLVEDDNDDDDETSNAAAAHAASAIDDSTYVVGSPIGWLGWLPAVVVHTPLLQAGSPWCDSELAE